MAVPAKKKQKKQNLPSVPEASLTPVQSLAAQLMGKGYTVPQVAERLVDYIIRNSRAKKAVRLKMARNRIRAWARTQHFRDAMYDAAIIALDLDSPLILQGVGRKAKAGRVDAAKLALEVTGRHTPKGEPQPTQVEVQFFGVPRPARGEEDEEVEGEVVEDAELEE